MSHFSVAVIHYPEQSIDYLLERYCECLDVPKYVRFTKEEAIKYARDNYRSELIDGRTDDECWELVAESFDEDMIDSDGNLYSTYNPNSKWDWYDIGGRWDKFIELKDGSFANEAKLNDIQFEPSQKRIDEYIKYFNERPDDLYLHQRYGNAETYAREVNRFTTFAVVTPDGKWHERGQMGWWGMSSETKEEAKDWEEHYMENYILPYINDEKLILTMVDCHI